jgi:hypothetical protein
MIRVRLDDDLRQKFHNFTDDVEIVDADGSVVARFQRSTPWSDPDQWELLTPEIPQEEIERRLNEDGPTYTTAQVIEALGKL